MTDQNDAEVVAEVNRRIIDVLGELTELRQQVARHRDWLFLPGDKVLVLHDSTIYDGEVVRVCIPGPLRDDLTIYIRCDDERVRLHWWNQDQVERIGQ